MRTGHRRNGHAGAAPLNTVSNGDGTATAAAGGNNRDGKGRFCSGNHAAKGNPHHRRMCQLRRALLDALTDDRLRELADALHRQAVAGNVAAAKLLLLYALGKPPATVDPDREALHEFRLLDELPT